MRAAWHIVPYVQTGYTAAEIAGHCLFSIAFRVVLVRIATAANDSIWPAVVGHAVYDIAWAISPNAGLDYDPWIAAALTAGLAACLHLAEHAARNRGRRPNRSQRWPRSASLPHKRSRPGHDDRAAPGKICLLKRQPIEFASVFR